ncbi:MAG: RdgB/HAM1 family non-canonical purine NTP pyrophosphatase [Alphaproteobacteria bacterium GM202ARS2]|nr:RdgB/HAM1 family non-canonical purine NTP pyrophosphatase [Alphaproteobacteria bacterium GM202ARS2]
MLSTLVIASHNIGKVIELRQLVAEHTTTNVTIQSLSELGIPEPEETESTFVGNAILKARHAFDQCHLPCLADDSGLEVTCLDGRPGIYSARWALHPHHKKRDFTYAMHKVNDAIGTHPDRSARFICALAWLTPDHPQPQTFVGTVDGTLCWPPRGTHGFGYDPMFIPNNHTQTFGEMTPKEKQPLTHRYRAFQQWCHHVFPTPNPPTP